MKLQHYFYFSTFFLCCLLCFAIIGSINDLFMSFDEIPIYADGNWLDVRASAYSGGDGTLSSPFQISSAEELALLAYEVNSNSLNNGNYELTNDIDLSQRIWIPIGHRELPFYGSFNGNNHTISGLTINGDNTGFGLYGLFGDIESGSAKNIVFSNVTMQNSISDSNNACVGVLTGASGSSLISNIKITSGYMNFYEVSHIGSVVGYSWSSIDKCMSDIEMYILRASTVGGIVGYTNSVISESFSYTTVSSAYGENLGGIAGASDAEINNSFNKGKVDGMGVYGSLVGLMSKDIVNCYVVDTIIVTGVQSSGNQVNVYVNITSLEDLPQSIWGIKEYINDNNPYLKWFYWEEDI